MSVSSEASPEPAPRRRLALRAGILLLLLGASLFLFRGLRGSSKRSSKLDLAPARGDRPADATTSGTPQPDTNGEPIARTVSAGPSAPGGKSAGPDAFAYAWSPKAVYRFQYQKVVRVSGEEEGTGRALLGRATDLSGVLVLEIESVDGNGTASAALRFDHSQVFLPTARSREAPLSKEEEQGRQMASAMEESFKETRWKVTLSAQGRLRALGRTPSHDWLHKLEQAGKWRKKSVVNLYTLIENDLRLSSGVLDEELLICPGESAGATEPAGLLDPLRVRRRVALGKRREDERAELTLTRFGRAGAEEEAPLEIPYLDPSVPPVRVLPGKVESLEGRALFDLKMKMLDSAAEKYRVSMRLTCGGQSIRQAVEVSYRLSRLAPPLRELRLEGEEGLAP